MIQFENRSANRLVRAYNRMVGVMRDAFNGKQRSSMTLQRALEIARNEIVNDGTLTADEAWELAEYIKMDVNDGAELMMEFCAEFYEWLSLDIDIIERKVMDMFLSVADNTRNIIAQVQHGPARLADSPSSKLKRIAGPDMTRSNDLLARAYYGMICAHCGLNRHPGAAGGTCEACGHDKFIKSKKDHS